MSVDIMDAAVLPPVDQAAPERQAALDAHWSLPELDGPVGYSGGLRELGTRERTEPRTGDEAVRDERARRAGGYAQADVNTWPAHALAAHRGHDRDPAAREPAAGLLTPPGLARVAPLAGLVRLVLDADVGDLAGAAPLSTTEPEAAGHLAALLAVL
ncbi:hypothetical protein ACWGBV_12975 [Streptomyces sp. NPDC055051]